MYFVAHDGYRMHVWLLYVALCFLSTSHGMFIAVRIRNSYYSIGGMHTLCYINCKTLTYCHLHDIVLDYAAQFMKLTIVSYIQQKEVAS
jgi:hypothetical protein